MIKWFHSRLGRFIVIVIEWLRVKPTNVIRGFIIHKNALKKFLLSFFKRLRNVAPTVFFDRYHEILLLKGWAELLLLLSLSTICWTIVVALDSFDDTRRFLHPGSVNEAVIGTTSILLALLIPLAIALIEDARDSPLARQAVARNILRFQILPVILLLVCTFLFMPQGITTAGTITLRNAFAAVIGACIAFLLINFYRAYRWLNDSSTSSTGLTEVPPPNQPQGKTPVSYRFAHIAKLLRNTNGHAAWAILWSRWFPPEYENALHDAFFRRQKDILKNKKVKKYTTLLLELDTYNTHFVKRNKDSWWFCMDYIKEFLLLYIEVAKLIEANRRTARAILVDLLPAQTTLENIIKKIISSSLDKERIWCLFEAMNRYIIDADLLSPRNEIRSHRSSLLTYFLNEYFENIFDGRIDSYADSYPEDYKHWLVTYDNLFRHQHSVTSVIEASFKGWLFKKLDAIKDSPTGVYKIDSIIGRLFPEADPITIADMYWLLYQVENTSESDLVIKKYCAHRPFGVFGRTFVSDWVDDKDQRMKNHGRAQQTQENNAIKLFGRLYANYFRQSSNLEKLIKTTQEIITQDKGDEEKETARLQWLLEELKKLRDFYKNDA